VVTAGTWLQPVVHVNSAFHPSGVGKLSTGLPGWYVHLRRVAGNTVWSHMAGDAP